MDIKHIVTCFREEEGGFTNLNLIYRLLIFVLDHTIRKVILGGIILILGNVVEVLSRQVSLQKSSKLVRDGCDN